MSGKLFQIVRKQDILNNDIKKIYSYENYDISVALVNLKKDESIDYESHNKTQITMCIKGTCEINVEVEMGEINIIKLHEDDLIIIYPNTNHKIIGTDISGTKILHIYGPKLDKFSIKK